MKHFDIDNAYFSGRDRANFCGSVEGFKSLLDFNEAVIAEFKSKKTKNYRMTALEFDEFVHGYHDKSDDLAAWRKFMESVLSKRTVRTYFTCGEYREISSVYCWGYARAMQLIYSSQQQQ